MLSGIWIKAVPEFDYDLDALLGRHSCVFTSIRFVGFPGTPEKPYNFFHPLNCIRLLSGTQSGALGCDSLVASIRKALYPGEDRIGIEVRFGDYLGFQTARQPLVIPVGSQ